MTAEARALLIQHHELTALAHKCRTDGLDGMADAAERKASKLAALIMRKYGIWA